MKDSVNHKQQLLDRFKLEKILGKGHYAKVFSAFDIENNRNCAIKIINYNEFDQSQKKILSNEFDLVNTLNSSYIIKIHEVFETKLSYIQIMELCEGGTLEDYMKKRNSQNSFLTEDEGITIMKQIFIAVDHFHSVGGIIHRDIKPANILLKYPNSLNNLKVADFGLSVTNKSFGIPKKITQGAGTPIFMAPEVLQMKEYNTRVDIWTCGIVMWGLLFKGGHPFYKERDTTKKQLQRTLNTSIDYTLLNCSALAKDLLQKLQNIDPGKRYLAGQALNHPWLTGKGGVENIPLTGFEIMEIFFVKSGVKDTFRLIMFINHIKYRFEKYELDQKNAKLLNKKQSYDKNVKIQSPIMNDIYFFNKKYIDERFSKLIPSYSFKIDPTKISFLAKNPETNKTLGPDSLINKTDINLLKIQSKKRTSIYNKTIEKNTDLKNDTFEQKNNRSSVSNFGKVNKILASNRSFENCDRRQKNNSIKFVDKNNMHKQKSNNDNFVEQIYMFSDKMKNSLGKLNEIKNNSNHYNQINETDPNLNLSNIYIDKNNKNYLGSVIVNSKNKNNTKKNLFFTSRKEKKENNTSILLTHGECDTPVQNTNRHSVKSPVKVTPNNLPFIINNINPTQKQETDLANSSKFSHRQNISSSTKVNSNQIKKFCLDSFSSYTKNERNSASFYNNNQNGKPIDQLEVSNVEIFKTYSYSKNFFNTDKKATSRNLKSNYNLQNPNKYLAVDTIQRLNDNLKEVVESNKFNSHRPESNNQKETGLLINNDKLNFQTAKNKNNQTYIENFFDVKNTEHGELLTLKKNNSYRDDQEKTDKYNQIKKRSKSNHVIKPKSRELQLLVSETTNENYCLTKKFTIINPEKKNDNTTRQQINSKSFDKICQKKTKIHGQSKTNGNFNIKNLKLNNYKLNSNKEGRQNDKNKTSFDK